MDLSKFHRAIEIARAHKEISALCPAPSLVESQELPQSFQVPLLHLLQSINPAHVSASLDALNDLYSFHQLSQSLLLDLSTLLPSLPQSPYLSKFCLSILIGESSPESKLHGPSILSIITPLLSTPHATHAVKTIATRLDNPPDVADQPVFEKDASLLLNLLLTLPINQSLQLCLAFIECDTHEHPSVFSKYVSQISSLALKHLFSTSIPAFTSSLSLSLFLIVHYREIMKPEISLFFSLIFKHLTTLSEFRTLSLSALTNLPADFLCELFANFDCDVDLHEQNLFESLIKHISMFTDGIPTLTALFRTLLTLTSTQSKETVFSQQKQLKKKISQAIDFFNANPIKGLSSLTQTIPSTPASIATFLHKNSSIVSPAAVGEVLGSVKHREILKEYIEQVDLTSLSLVSALYKFLSLFRLPVESQQIDRILEEFALSYYSRNPTLKSAEVCYDASFAILMLHTDAHNKNVKHKMTKQQFMKLCRELDEGSFLPVEFLEETYDYVVNHEMSLSPTINLPQGNTRLGEEVMTKAHEEIQEARRRMRSQKWVRPVSPEIVRVMFEEVWANVAVFEDLDLLLVCLQIAANFYMETESEWCLSSILRIKDPSVNEKLLKIALETPFYESVWERLLSVREIIETDELIEGTGRFPPGGLIAFVSAFCKVVNNNLTKSGSYLIKLVEVAHINCERERYVWNKIWKPISALLIEAGCGIYSRLALDSLRQLAGKFLIRESRDGFTYQRDFLRPFVAILRKGKSKETREYAIRCLIDVALRHHGILKSGWDEVFSALGAAAVMSDVRRYALNGMIEICSQFLDEVERIPLRESVKFVRTIGEPAAYLACQLVKELREREMKIQTDSMDQKERERERDNRERTGETIEIVIRSGFIRVIEEVVERQLTEEAVMKMARRGEGLDAIKWILREKESVGEDSTDMAMAAVEGAVEGVEKEATNILKARSDIKGFASILQRGKGSDMLMRVLRTVGPTGEEKECLSILVNKGIQGEEEITTALYLAEKVKDYDILKRVAILAVHEGEKSREAALKMISVAPIETVRIIAKDVSVDVAKTIPQEGLRCFMTRICEDYSS